MPVRDLKRETCLERLEDEESEPVTDRNKEFFSTTLDIKDNDPVNERKREPCLAKLVAEPNDPATDLNNEFFSARLDDGLSEATRALPIPLAMEPAAVNVSLRDRKKDACFERLDTMFQFAVTVVEQDRGLVLQTSFPELTFATRLPIVLVIESVSVLKMPFFAAPLDAVVKKPASDLKNENLSAGLEADASEALALLRKAVCSAIFLAEVSAPLRDLKIEDFSARLEDPVKKAERILTKVVFSAEFRVRDPLRLWAESQLGVIMSDAVETVVSVAVVAEVEPEYCITVQYSTARYFPLHPLNAGWVAEVQVYCVAVVDPITSLVDESQFLNRNVHVPRLLVVHCQTVIQSLPTGLPFVDPAAKVMSNCQVPEKMSDNPLWIPAVL
jgi:hypothetical protein